MWTTSICVAFAVLATVSASLAQLDTNNWATFKKRFAKKYNNGVEEVKRRQLFEKRVAEINAHNARFNSGRVSFRKGVNKFTDWTDAELKAYLPKAHKPRALVTGGLGNRDGDRNPATSYLKHVSVKPTASVDWRQGGYVTPVKDQGDCGSCWAFSATGALESHWKRAYGGELQYLSEQQLVDCSTKNYGCHGGDQDYAFDYIKKNGITNNASYPYKAEESGECLYNGTEEAVAQIAGYADIRYSDEEHQRVALATIGPLAVSIHVVSDFFYYESGVFFSEECDRDQLNHAVLAVGYGTDEIHGDYWIIKNSWSTEWGEDGYIRMARNRGNNCGIASESSYPLV